MEVGFGFVGICGVDVERFEVAGVGGGGVEVIARPGVGDGFCVRAGICMGAGFLLGRGAAGWEARVERDLALSRSANWAADMRVPAGKGGHWSESSLAAIC